MIKPQKPMVGPGTAEFMRRLLASGQGMTPAEFHQITNQHQPPAGIERIVVQSMEKPFAEAMRVIEQSAPSSYGRPPRNAPRVTHFEIGTKRIGRDVP